MTNPTRNSAHFLLLSSILFVLYACSDKIPSLPRLSPDAVIVAFGDSLTYGTGTQKDHSYPAVLQELSQRTVINAGIPGELSAQGVARLSGVLDKHNPALLILCHGGNDILRKRSKSQLAENLKKMISTAQQRGIAVVMIGVPEPKLAFMQTLPLYKDIAKQFNIPIEADILPEVEKDKQLKSDTIHPNGHGYRLIAEAVHQLLQKSGTI